MATRDELLAHLAEVIGSIAATHPIRVGIDGAPAAGKTTLADDLAVVLRARGRHVIRAGIDDFLFPRAQRYRRGEYSAEACYYDNHDYAALNRVLLDPLGPGGDCSYQTAIYDRSLDGPPPLCVRSAPTDAVLLFDGVFLMRPELIDRWDLRIFVSVPFDTTVQRALVRERGQLADPDIERRWRERYIPSQEIYFATVHPLDHADVIVQNENLEQPTWRSR